MKAIFFIAGMMLSITCLGQQVFSLKATTMALPNGTTQISKEQALSEAVSKFKGNKTASIFINGSRPQQIYEVDNVIISLYADNGPVPQKRLLTLQKGFDEAASGIHNYSSIIKKFNEYNVLLIKDSFDNIGHYSFYTTDEVSNMASGSLIYNLADSAKATAALNHILQNLKFKIQ